MADSLVPVQPAPAPGSTAIPPLLNFKFFTAVDPITGATVYLQGFVLCDTNGNAISPASSADIEHLISAIRELHQAFYDATGNCSPPSASGGAMTTG